MNDNKVICDYKLFSKLSTDSMINVCCCGPSANHVFRVVRVAASRCKHAVNGNEIAEFNHTVLMYHILCDDCRLFKLVIIFLKSSTE